MSAKFKYCSVRIFLIVIIVQLEPVASSSAGKIAKNNEAVHQPCKVLEDFPRDIEMFPHPYVNWAHDLQDKEGVWTAIPKNPDQVLRIINYAYRNGLQIRASGFSHTWAPITVVPGNQSQSQNSSKEKDEQLQQHSDCSIRNNKIILIKTNETLTDMRMVANRQDILDPTASSSALWTQSGASMGKIVQFLENNGFGLNAIPAPGEITIGGVIAIAGHGTGVPAFGERLTPGRSYGSISNLIIDLTAAVWDDSKQEYIFKRFHRSDPETKAFLVNLGRTFILDLTLSVIKNYYLRCESRIDITARELFSDPKLTSETTRTLASIIESSGRVETILFPFTSRPWLKIWSLSPNRPLLSRKVTEPYNYPFSDSIPAPVALLASNITAGAWGLAPLLGEAEYNMVVTGLATHLASDLWGLSKNLLLYIQPTTLRVTENGIAILTSREDIQRVLHESFSYYEALMYEYQSRSEFPINGPLEVRVSGTDDPRTVNVMNAESPGISPLNPTSDIRRIGAFDTVVWFNILSFPGTPLINQFMFKMEQFFYSRFNGGYALVRPEFSKGWAYTNSSSWNNVTMLQKTIPELFPNWNLTKEILNKYDPHFVFTNDFLQQFFV